MEQMLHGKSKGEGFSAFFGNFGEAKISLALISSAN